MKILCVIDSLRSGGAQRQLVNLAKGFKERGHEVSFLVYHPDDFYSEELEKAVIRITYILESNYLKRLIKMRRYIRKGGFDAVLSFLEAANFITTVSGFPYKKWTLVVGERSANPNILKSFKLRFYRWFHLFADYVVSNSVANMHLVKKANPLLRYKKKRVIYNMLNISNNFVEEKVVNKNKTNSVFRLIIGASHSKLKNLDGLVEAVNLLPLDKKRQLKVDWYGEKDLDKSLYMAKTKINKYQLTDIFTFYDPTPSLYAKMKEADGCGLFSFYEGFPNFICESMVLGKPIICTEVSDLPLLLKNNTNVFFCNASYPTSISNAFINLMEMTKDKHDKMIKSNKKIAAKYFDKELIIDSYLNLLNKK